MLKFTFGLIPLVLLTGFFVAGISGGTSCNTYPKVGDNYFISKKHLNGDIPLWQNFTENKLVAQVNHRTFATILTLLATYQVGSFMAGASLTKQARIASAFLVLALWSQLGIGVKTIWESAPIYMCSTHQIGAMTVLTAFVLQMHTCRRVDQRHLKNLLGKLRVEDPKAFQQMTTSFNKNTISKRQYEQMRMQYDKQ